MPPTGENVFIFFFCVNTRKIQFLFVEAFFQVCSFEPIPANRIIQVDKIFEFSTVPKLRPCGGGPKGCLSVCIFRTFPSVVTMDSGLICPIVNIVLSRVPLRVFFYR